ncbi:predicted Hydrolase or acyltransferase (alpha/beta hydrolase superfamily) [Hahella chejuensis KCTC 2396]|uniref:Predicted Hydrolase or acyltransferase (Alpha/beta hydrolase superfamily) n=1 Tax=Hahella chejuensis (strain KCTC 2396) TaxID=349521 RepID=Q2SKV5_HAHCH|nr:alpha/beta hydrolase [Hahella chejuensis]ABC28719.1 predicted Hydrolase or acyltransferase (alpha/beta hydrolase superfamily) [Hahella chejuensis KCTC 2396]
MTVEHVAVGDIQLAYETFGSRKDPCILLIMGLGAQMLVWPDALCERLAANGYFVVRFDNRDIGLSSKSDGEGHARPVTNFLRKQFGLKVKSAYTLSDLANDAIGLLNALRIANAHFFGASMGGMIAQIAAAKYPERALSLTSIMSAPGFSRLPALNPANLLALIKPMRPKSRAEIIESKINQIRRIGSRSYPSSRSELLQRVGKVLDRSPVDHEGLQRQASAILAEGSLVELQKRIITPTLIIHGDEDSLIPLSEGVACARNIRGAQLEVIAGMGHDFPSPLIARVAKVVLQHVGEATTRTGNACEQA